MKKSSLQLWLHTDLVAEIWSLIFSYCLTLRKGQSLCQCRVNLPWLHPLSLLPLIVLVQDIDLSQSWPRCLYRKNPVLQPSLLTNHTIPMPAQRSSLRSDYSELKHRWSSTPKRVYSVLLQPVHTVCFEQAPAKQDAFVASLLPFTIQIDLKGWTLGGLLKLLTPAVQEVFNPPCSPFL